ncbi:MAG TPA: dicarboxylate/amino acid:cation symporter [Nevskiaceae bacterium]|nr:dicarboxylate/amino acid:cation symporter [Nevskiaceae bacterium]
MTSTPRRLYVYVLCAIVLGALFGIVDPAHATLMKPLGDGFIKLIKMLIAPVIFCTVVTGIAGMRDAKKVGRVGAKALLYFEVVSTIALAIGLVVVNLLKPGAGFNVDPSTLDAKAVADYATRAHEQSATDFILNIIPSTLGEAFAKGDILQVLLVALLFGFALSALGERGLFITEAIEGISKVLFGMVGIVMRAAPIGAFGAMAFTIGKYGVASLAPLARLMGSFYLTCVLFVAIVLGAICRLLGIRILHFIRYIRAELLTVLGTSSSESVLVPMMEKLERLGCSRSVVGLVIPSGYSFNLDGTNIYLTMAAIFVAQALNVDLTLSQQLTILGVAMLTSKGASGVTGAGFVTLAATLSVVPGVPPAGLALILGIDRFMSEARALTNLVGNGVATLVVSRWERELDAATLQRELAAPPD